MLQFETSLFIYKFLRIRRNILSFSVGNHLESLCN